MCCDVCPYFDECEELDDLREECCADCPDLSDCQGGLEGALKETGGEESET